MWHILFATTENFIQRWGTHYIKSAKFGGQLQIRKTKQAKQGEKKTEFAVEMEMEYKTLFSSVGAKYSQKNGYQQREQVKTSSTSIMAQGGSQEIASILSDAYSPTFKTEFKEWLQSIPRYPKAFKFLMGSIVDLVNFRSHDLFPEEKVGSYTNVITQKLIHFSIIFLVKVDPGDNVTRTISYLLPAQSVSFLFFVQTFS